MSEQLDNQGGSAANDGLKSQSAAGLGVDSVNVEGVLKNNKELLTEKKALQDRLAKLEQAEKKRQDEESLKRGEHEKLLVDRDARLKIVVHENKVLKIANKAVLEHKLVDADAVILFADKVNDDMSNLSDVILELKEKKPYLFEMPHALTQVVVTPTDKTKGATPQPGHIFTRAECRDPKIYAANKEAILDQYRRGLIKN